MIKLNQIRFPSYWKSNLLSFMFCSFTDYLRPFESKTTQSLNWMNISINYVQKQW